MIYKGVPAGRFVPALLAGIARGRVRLPGLSEGACRLPQSLSAHRFTTSATMAAGKWGYADQAGWASLPGCVATGDSQSPIHIQTAGVVKSQALKPLKLTGWETAFTGTVCNNGHSVQFNPNPGQQPASLEIHTGVYEGLQFHFHWGECHGKGSEHLIDGTQYDLEIHFVHKKVGDSSGGSAPDSLAVLAVMGTEDSRVDGTTGIWKALAVPQQYNSTLSLGGIRFVELLPPSLDYYHYQGSLTTPPCSEIVQWLVLKEPIGVPREFLESLRRIEDEEGEHLCHNYRDLQLINKRTIETPAH